MTSNIGLTKKERRAIKKQEKLAAKAQKKKGTSMKKYLNWSIGILIIVGVLFFIKTAMTPSSSNGPIAGMTEASASDWSKGATDSATLVIEYSDFQCPACAGYQVLTSQLIEEHGDTVQFVYRHFPLSQHKNARPAAYAAEAAGLQGKFWEMHDMLFIRQGDWSEEKNAEEIFVSYAEELKLDIEQFTTDASSSEVKDKVDADYASGVAARINSTPSFFVNGQKIPSPRSYDDFASIILAQETMQESSHEAAAMEDNDSAEDIQEEIEASGSADQE